MTLDFTALNLLAIFICVILSNGLAMFWYSPMFLGKPYAAITGMKITGPPSPKKFAVGFGASIIFVLTIAIFVQLLGIHTMPMALTFGLLASFGILVAIILPIYAYNEFGIKLFLIDVGLSVVTTLMNAIILTIWV